MHNNYSEAIIGNDILNSQAPSNNAQEIGIEYDIYKIKYKNYTVEGRCTVVIQ